MAISGSSPQAYAMTATSNGDIFLVGQATYSDSSTAFLVVEYNFG